MTPGNDTTAVSIDDIDQSDCNSPHRNNIPRHVEPILFVLWTMFWFISTIKIIDSRDGTLTAYYLQIASFLCNAALWMEWNSHKFVADGPGTGRSVKCRVYRGLKWLSLGRGKFHQDILQSGRKNNNMAGRSGIGVLVTGFSLVGALKKHAPLVFTVMYINVYISEMETI